MLKLQRLSQKITFLTVIVFVFFFILTKISLSKKISANLSSHTVKAGDKMTIEGTIPPGEELDIVITAQTTFCPNEAIGEREKSRLIKDGKKFDFASDTSIPYLYYIITSQPESYGRIVYKGYGGAFFFKGLYQTEKFKLSDWDELPDKVKAHLGPINNEEQWNFLRYAHEISFGINTIGKEETKKGKVLIFARMVLSDYEENPDYFNKGTMVFLNKETGEFSANFETFRHTCPNTEFSVYVNSRNIGSYVVKGEGFWLPMGWRYANLLVIVGGALIIGVFHSMVGAAGGMLMAAFQILLVGTAGPLGINGANILKCSNLAVVFSAPLASMYYYWFKEKRLAWPASIALGIGIFLGSFIIGPPLSAKYLNMTTYKPWLAVLLSVIVLKMVYEMVSFRINKKNSPNTNKKKSTDKEENPKAERNTITIGRIKTVKFSFTSYHFKFQDREFRVNFPVLVVSGIFIGIIASSFGISGGFMVVPVLTILGGLSMYIAVPISLLSGIFIATFSITKYSMMEYFPDPWIMLSIIIGGLAGGLIGGRTQRFFTEKQLKWALIVVLFFLIFKFLGIQIWI